jgi:hypothetical protein
MSIACGRSISGGLLGEVCMLKSSEPTCSESLRIKDTASREGVDIVEKLPSRLAEKKLQFLFSKALMQACENQFEQQMATHGTPADKARILSNDGSFLEIVKQMEMPTAYVSSFLTQIFPRRLTSCTSLVRLSN